MKYEAPINAEEALLVLTNERTVYPKLISEVQYFADTAESANYDLIRSSVFNSCTVVFKNYGPKNKKLTSQLVPLVMEKYWEEVTGTQWGIADLARLERITPVWALEHTKFNSETNKMNEIKHDFKVGDVVEVIQKPHKADPPWNAYMDQMINKKFTVKKVNDDNIEVKENHWFWDPRAFRLLSRPLEDLRPAPAIPPVTPASTITVAPILTSTQEQIMTQSAKAISQITYIFGIPRENVSDDAIFEHIRALEAKIQNLEKIDNKPKKLVAKIDALKQDIQDLIKLVDDDADDADKAAK